MFSYVQLPAEWLNWSRPHLSGGPAVKQDFAFRALLHGFVCGHNILQGPDGPYMVIQCAVGKQPLQALDSTLALRDSQFVDQEEMETQRKAQAEGFTPEKATRILTSPGPGAGVGKSPYRKTSFADPFSSYQAASIECLPPRKQRLEKRGAG